MEYEFDIDMNYKNGYPAATSTYCHGTDGPFIDRKGDLPKTKHR